MNYWETGEYYLSEDSAGATIVTSIHGSVVSHSLRCMNESHAMTCSLLHAYFTYPMSYDKTKK